VENPEDTNDGLFEQWRQRRAREGERVNLMDLYDLVGEANGVAPQELPLAERQALAARALTVIWPGFEQVAPVRVGDQIEIMEHEPGWASTFVTWRDRLAESLGPTALRIDHIGSTSVPGLAAKPIIDIQLSVARLDEESDYVPGCVGAGFELYSRDEVHRFFHVPPPSPRVAQLHLCQSGGEFEYDHLLFRDYLRANPDERDAYAAMKREAAKKWKDDRLGYTYAKGGFILERQERANVWASASAWTVARSE
jgi:GrpB-like predicted nucleotidyltransferase (UPF0157 family)